MASIADNSAPYAGEGLRRLKKTSQIRLKGPHWASEFH